jgi:hypothetical protein
MGEQRDGTHCKQEKSERELRVWLRPVEETLGDTIGWYRQKGWLETSAQKKYPLRLVERRS